MPGRLEVWSIVLGPLAGRRGRLAAQAAVIATVVGGTVAYSSMSKQVTLTVDGRTRQVRDDAGTVATLLADQRVPVSPRDLVAPGLNAHLRDGDHVVIRYARMLTVVIDGQPHTYWTTELTVDSALSALGIRSVGARLSASRSEPIGRAGLSLTVSTPKSVVLVADGKTRTVVTTATNVAELLQEQAVSIGPLDRLSVLQSAPTVDGMVVALTRVEQRTVSVVEPVKFTVTQQKSSALTVGQTKVLKAGKNGSRRATYRLLITDGKATGRVLVSITMITPAVAQVVQVGTKPSPSVNPNVGGSVDSLNWSALAQCESGGNPKAVNPAGYYGLYQFSLSTWHSVGGTGNPVDASPSEQLYRAKLLYKKGGAGQWGCGNKLFS